MAVAVIQGASRGIGLQYCRHLLANRPDTLIYATCRSPANANQLQELTNSHGNQRIRIAQLDVTNEEHISDVAKIVSNENKRVDLLVNCAAMLHPSGRGETSLRQVESQALSDTLLLNAVGPLLMAKHFAPLLQKGGGKYGSAESAHTGVVVNMSAKVGSITDNGLGGWYSYRMSKAALNMATKNLSIELGRGRSKVICVSLHPGTVDTDLSRPYHKGVPKDKLFTAEFSVTSMMKTINNLTFQQTGKFFSWDGTELKF